MSKFTYGLMSVSAALAVGLPIVLSGAAVAQDPAADALLKRLERMQRDINALSRQVYRGEGPPPSAASGPAGRTPSPPAGAGASTAYAARVQAKITQFEAELRDLTGQVEGFGNTLRRINERLDKLIGDVDFRLSSLEAARTAAPAGAAPAAPAAPRRSAGFPGVTLSARAPPKADRSPGAAGRKPSAPSPGRTSRAFRGPRVLRPRHRHRRAHRHPRRRRHNPPPRRRRPRPPPNRRRRRREFFPPGTPRVRYRFAYSLLRQADYDKAATAFEEFLGAHPNDKLASNARYWLGETHYVRRDYRTAANEFLTGFQKNPKGRRRPIRSSSSACR